VVPVARDLAHEEGSAVPTMRILALMTAAAAAAIGASLVAGMAVGPRGQLSAAETTHGPSRAGTANRAGGDTGSGLVTGYPGRVIPAVPGSTGLSTSVIPSGHQVQAALIGRLDGDPAAVLRFYRTRLTRLGFTAHERPAAGGATALAFTRGAGSVVVTATPGHPTSYSVFAVLAVGRA